MAHPVVLGDINLVRALALAGRRSYVFSRHAPSLRLSRHVAGVLPWVEPWSDPDRALGALLDFARAQDEPPVLLPEWDGDLVLLSRERARLGDAVRMALATPELVDDLADKQRFRALAERAGLPVPRSAPLDVAADAGLRLPVIVKPAHHTPAWDAVAGDSSSKAKIVRSAAELAQLREAVSEAGIEALAQEAIEGPETRIESYHAYVDAAGSVAGDFTGRKIRTWPATFGESTAVAITDEDDVRRVGRDVFERVGLTGVAKADFKRAGDGSLHLLEINPRFSLWNYPGAAAGANLPDLVVADLSGEPRPAYARGRAGVTWCQPTLDVRAARAEGVPVRRWLRFLAACEAPSVLSLRDPLPMVASVAGRAAA